VRPTLDDGGSPDGLEVPADFAPAQQAGTPERPHLLKSHPSRNPPPSHLAHRGHRPRRTRSRITTKRASQHEGRLEEEHASNLEVVREITALAFAPIRFDAKGDLLSPGDQLRGKLKALELLGKVHQLFGDSSVKLKTPAELDAILAKEILRVNGRERGEALVRALGLRVNLEQLH
jgi:hypothetical protein